MAAPTGIDREIYKLQCKTTGRYRFKIRLDRPIADADFVDEFAGAVLDTDLWNSWQPTNTSITVAGGKLTLASTADTNLFPMVESKHGKNFPQDLSIGWTLEWTMEFPIITGYGVFFRVCDIQNAEAIVAIKCNTADGLGLHMPDGTELENLGADVSSHDYALVYTPPTNMIAGQYELFRDAVSKGTIFSEGRQAWYIAIGNGSVQVAMGAWTNIAVSRVDVNLVTPEVQSWPGWTDKEVIGTETWGRIPFVTSFSVNSHKRNDLDPAMIEISVAGYITGLGYRNDLFAGYDWLNREVIIESQQSDGKRKTSWKKIFEGLCDEPAIRNENGVAILSVAIRESVRRQLQMFHPVRGYSDNAAPIDGVVMNKTWTEIIEDQCQVAGLDVAEYNVLADPLIPRSWNVLGSSALDAINELAEVAGAAVYRNAGQANHGRLEVQEWSWGTDTPVVFFGSDEDIILLDFAATDMGLAAQVIITVQHSEFGEFSDVYPHAPVPSFGAVMRQNAPIAQQAVDINVTRLLPYLRWKIQNREIKSIVISLIGQDWVEHDIEAQVIDRRVLKLANDDYFVVDYFVVDGWDYSWNPTQGLRTNIHLSHQHPDKLIRQLSLDRTIQVVY